jgi:hypothetical protein
MLKPLSFDRFLKSMAKIDTQSTIENQENSDDFFYIKDGNKYVRISLCAPVEKLEEAIRRIS